MSARVCGLQNGRKLVESFFAAVESGLAGVDFCGIFGMFAEMVEDGGLESAETEIEGVALHFGGAEFYGGGRRCRWHDGGEAIEDGAAGIAEGEELGDFVVGFAGGVVAGLADFPIAQN